MYPEAIHGKEAIDLQVDRLQRRNGKIGQNERRERLPRAGKRSVKLKGH